MLSLYCVTCVRVQGSVHAITVVMCSVWCLVCHSVSSFKTVELGAAGQEPGAHWPPQSSCQTRFFLMASVWSFWGKCRPESCTSNIPKAPAVHHIFTLHIVIATFLILWLIATFFCPYIFLHVHECTWKLNMSLKCVQGHVVSWVYVYMYVCVDRYTWVQVPVESGRRYLIPGAVIIGIRDLSDRNIGNPLWVFSKSSKCSKCWTVHL